MITLAASIVLADVAITCSCTLVETATIARYGQVELITVISPQLNSISNAVVCQGAVSNSGKAEGAFTDNKSFAITIIGLALPDFNIEASGFGWRAVPKASLAE